ncbi:MAG: hypothetical protein HDT25_03840 [Ruminococcus sp.]|nr:hypothetical protein [Ruminococcus sp.]
MKKSKVFPLIFLLIFIILICCIAVSSLPNKDEKLRKSEYLINSDSLIGKNINVCKDYWEEDATIYKASDTDFKTFYAGCINQRVFGMSDSQHYYVVVYYENDIITDLEILPYKNG